MSPGAVDLGASSRRGEYPLRGPACRCYFCCLPLDMLYHDGLLIPGRGAGRVSIVKARLKRSRGVAAIPLPMSSDWRSQPISLIRTSVRRYCSGRKTFRMPFLGVCNHTEPHARSCEPQRARDMQRSGIISREDPGPSKLEVLWTRLLPQVCCGGA